MQDLSKLLRNDEQITLKLRSLYSSYGYAQYKMSRFEEYELYAANRAFLPAGDIITFTGANGKLMALRPDVTLSIIKSAKSDKELKKLYYNENIYRTIDGNLKEQMQVGLEYIGLADTKQVVEVLVLAKKSLDILGKNTRLDISHMSFLNGLLDSENLTVSLRSDILAAISERNIPGINQLCSKSSFSASFKEGLISLASIYGCFSDVKDRLKKICVNKQMSAALGELAEIDEILGNLGINSGINIDFSVINDITYYNGVIFRGFIDSAPTMVLSGGRYDELARSFGKCDGAIGFAVYLDLAMRFTPKENREDGSQKNAEGMLGIALPKGRLGEKAYEIFKKAGFECPDMNDDSRKLVFENPGANIRYFWVKPSDVAIYVEQGIADIGVVGKDSLLEDSPDVYELLDLNIGKCRMCVAAEKDTGKDPKEPAVRTEHTLHVATKFPNVARTFYASRGRDIDVIKLHGSIELAPLLGLSDVIVDLVETGKTLEDNNMEVVETIAEISARLISNKVSHRFKHTEVTQLCEKIAEQLVGG